MTSAERREKVYKSLEDYFYVNIKTPESGVIRFREIREKIDECIDSLMNLTDRKKD